MPKYLYSVPGQTEGRSKTFLEWKSIDLQLIPSTISYMWDNVNYYKSVLQPISAFENWEHPSNFQSESVSSAFNTFCHFTFLKWNRYFSAVFPLFFSHKAVSLKFCISFSAIKHNSCILFWLNNYTLYFIKRSLLKSKFLRFSSAQVNICQIPRVNLELTSQFLFKFCIILHCHDTNFPCKFSVHKFSTFDKRIPSKFQFIDYQTCSDENFLILFLFFL